jgi:hypothetical protein
LGIWCASRGTGDPAEWYVESTTPYNWHGWSLNLFMVPRLPSETVILENNEEVDMSEIWAPIFNEFNVVNVAFVAWRVTNPNITPSLDNMDVIGAATLWGVLIDGKVANTSMFYDSGDNNSNFLSQFFKAPNLEWEQYGNNPWYQMAVKLSSGNKTPDPIVLRKYLKEQAFSKNGVKLLLSFGGANAVFPLTVNDANTYGNNGYYRKMGHLLAQVVEENEYDGLNLDIEGMMNGGINQGEGIVTLTANSEEWYSKNWYQAFVDAGNMGAINNKATDSGESSKNVVTSLASIFILEIIKGLEEKNFFNKHILTSSLVAPYYDIGAGYSKSDSNNEPWGNGPGSPQLSAQRPYSLVMYDILKLYADKFSHHSMRFYNQGGATYDEYQYIVVDNGDSQNEGSPSAFPNSSVLQLAAEKRGTVWWNSTGNAYNGKYIDWTTDLLPLSKIVIGKPMTEMDVYNSGYLTPTKYNNILRQTANETSWKAGIMFWQAQNMDGKWSWDAVKKMMEQVGPSAEGMPW